MITDANGAVISRRDFMPFGEELGAGVGPRTEALKYSLTGSDNIRKRFTGYQKDHETGLDFAEARMYQNKHGRFTAVDPLLASASATNPQTFNRYTYTGNDPVNHTDPSGLSWCMASDGTVTWNGAVGRACEKGTTNVDGQQLTQVSGPGGRDSNGRPHGIGSVILFGRDGSRTVVQAPPQQQGQAVAAGTQNTAGGTATEAAASSAASGGNAEGGVTQLPTASGTAPADLLLLPCPTDGSGCGSGTKTWQSLTLDTSKNAPLKSVEGIARLFELCSLAPGVGSACAVGAAATRFGQGKFGDAGDNTLNVVPFLGILRKADKANDVFGGGRFDDLPMISGLERHHMPADSFSQISRADGPAIQMTKADHRATSSWGNSNRARAYRAHLKTLSARDAMAAEIRDVRRIGGRKYNRAILEMLDYAKRGGYLNR